jgi:hypothetical protein
MPKYKKHSTEAVQDAVEKILSGIWTVRYATHATGIPKSTLHDKVKKKHMKPVGNTRVFNDREEEEFVFHLQTMERNKYVTFCLHSIATWRCAVCP